jgi:lysophospholipid acyltransferase (LPLAT)-like uncharacterized protein
MRLRPPGGLVHAIAWSLTRSLNFRTIGLDRLRRAVRMSPTGAIVACLWHQSLFAAIGAHAGGRLKVAALASLSGDGEIIADYLRRVGIRPVRGSSARGGARAAKELMTAIEEGWLLAIALDGPRGPWKEAKSGPLELARRHGLPILPVAARASRELAFKRSWDRFRLPLPRAQVAVCYGEPWLLPLAEPTPAELEARRRALAAALNRLEARASRLVGQPDAGPPAAALTWMRGPLPT